MMNLDDCQFNLPDRLIATAPASPRDAAKLLVYDTATDEVVFDTFRHLGKYLPPQALVVLNDTKVLPARVPVVKDTGGRAEILFLLNEPAPAGLVSGLADRKLVVGQVVTIDHRWALTVVGQSANLFLFRPKFPLRHLPRIMTQSGQMPLPPYLKQTKLSEHQLRDKYQAVFAAHPASVAAPTASLHFTKRLLADLRREGIKTTTVTLHVGRGTFAPLTAEQVASGKLHEEPYLISGAAARQINQAKTAGRPVIAVGTTATRAIESAASRGRVSAGAGATKIFIRPPHKFQIIDGLVTNFHLPGTSLLLLVDALLRDKHASRSVTDLYKLAIKKNFRFYSFGDGMLIK